MFVGSLPSFAGSAAHEDFHCSRLQLLRHGTRAAHEAVEAVPCMRRLLASDYGLSEYKQLLVRLFAYVQPLETKLSESPSARFQLACSRSDKLVEDLGALGVPLEVVHAAPLRGFESLDFCDESVRAGVVYVFEGSALGGQVIRRTLTRNLGGVVNDALSYFDCYQGAPGQVWRRTTQQIEQALDLDNGRMINSALTIFASLTDWLAGDRARAAHMPTTTLSRCPFAHTRAASAALV